MAVPTNFCETNWMRYGRCPACFVIFSANRECYFGCVENRMNELTGKTTVGTRHGVSAPLATIINQHKSTAKREITASLRI